MIYKDCLTIISNFKTKSPTYNSTIKINIKFYIDFLNQNKQKDFKIYIHARGDGKNCSS